MAYLLLGWQGLHISTPVGRSISDGCPRTTARKKNKFTKRNTPDDTARDKENGTKKQDKRRNDTKKRDASRNSKRTLRKTRGHHRKFQSPMCSELRRNQGRISPLRTGRFKVTPPPFLLPKVQKGAAKAEKWHIYFGGFRVSIFSPRSLEGVLGRLDTRNRKRANKVQNHNAPDETERHDDHAPPKVGTMQKLEKSKTQITETPQTVRLFEVPCSTPKQMGDIPCAQMGLKLHSSSSPVARESTCRHSRVPGLLRDSHY